MSKIERSRELYAAIKTFAPHVQWNESKWRAYKATHVCPNSQRLWLHFAIEDLLKQTEGKLTLKDVSALMQEDLKFQGYDIPPIINTFDDDLTALRHKLRLAGHTSLEMHLIVWEVHKRGLKGDAAAQAARCSRQTFGRYLKEVYDAINYIENETEDSIIILGQYSLLLQGRIFLPQYLTSLRAALDRTLKVTAEDGWIDHYLYWLQECLESETVTPAKKFHTESWIKRQIVLQEKTINKS